MSKVAKSAGKKPKKKVARRTTIELVTVKYEGSVFSPFSGKPAERDDGPNEGDPTLLFTHYGDAGEYGYVSARALAAAGLNEDQLEGVEPKQLLRLLSPLGAVGFCVDTGWNGINSYGFAPPSAG